MDDKNKTTTQPDENGNVVGEDTMTECSNGRGEDEDKEDL